MDGEVRKQLNELNREHCLLMSNLHDCMLNLAEQLDRATQLRQQIDESYKIARTEDNEEDD